MSEPATARLVSLPPPERPMLNRLQLVKGRAPQPGERHAVVVSESLAREHGLALGQQIHAVLNGRWQALDIVGMALSPEYVYEVGPGMLLPDPRHFGVLWMLREALSPVMDMDAAFNDVALSLSPQAQEPEVLAALDDLLRPYGAAGALGRDGQLSHRFLTDELAELGVVTTTIPTLFLGVASFLLYVVLTRLVETQRAQIGLLKAFGYTHARVGVHYLLLGLATVALGTALGLPLGVVLGDAFVGLYSEYFRFPELQFHLSQGLGLWVLGVMWVCAGLAAATAVTRAVRMSPAQAMRASAPTVARVGLARLRRWAPWLSLSMTLMARNLARHPWKATLSVVGIASAVGLMLVGRFALDAAQHVLAVQFQWVHRDDLTVFFRDARAASAVQVISKMPGVHQAEGFRLVPVVLHHGHQRQRLELTALTAPHRMRLLWDEPSHPVDLPSQGLVLSCKLAKMLKISPGDSLEVEVLEGRRPTLMLVMQSCINDYVGLSAFVDAQVLSPLLHDDGWVSGVAVKRDKGQSAQLYEQLRRLPVVRGLAIRESMQDSLRDMLDRSFLFFSTVVLAFASVIVAGVVYNSARIALTERGHEMASLGVLGFSQTEVGVLLLGEQALILALALPLGLCMGVGLCKLMVPAFDRELFRLPLVLGPWAFVAPGVASVSAAVVSGWMVVRRVRSLDLVSVLKTRE